MELTVEKRDTKAKPKALREKGVLPAVVYGRAQEATPIAVNTKIFTKLYQEAGESTVVTLKGLGDTKDVLIHEVALDPVTMEPVHADFYAIAAGQKVTVSVPLEFTGTAPAVKDHGGILTKVMHELEIECEPKDLPHSIKVDVSTLATLEDQVQVKDLVLPASAETTAEADEVVAMISVAKEEEEEAPPADLSAIEISEERGKKEDEEGAEGGDLPAGKAGAAPAEKAEKPAGKEKKE